MPPLASLVSSGSEYNFGSIVYFGVFDLHKCVVFGLNDLVESIGKSVDKEFLIGVTCVFPEAGSELLCGIIALRTVNHESFVHCGKD